MPTKRACLRGILVSWAPRSSPLTFLSPISPTVKTRWILPTTRFYFPQLGILLCSVKIHGGTHLDLADFDLTGSVLSANQSGRGRRIFLGHQAMLPTAGHCTMAAFILISCPALTSASSKICQPRLLPQRSAGFHGGVACNLDPLMLTASLAPMVAPGACEIAERTPS